MSAATRAAYEMLFKHFREAVAKEQELYDSGAPSDVLDRAFEDVLAAQNAFGPALVLHVNDEKTLFDRAGRGEMVFSDIVLTDVTSAKEPRVWVPGARDEASKAPALACSAKPEPEIPAPTDDDGYGEEYWKARQFFNLPT